MDVSGYIAALGTIITLCAILLTYHLIKDKINLHIPAMSRKPETEETSEIAYIKIPIELPRLRITKEDLAALLLGKTKPSYTESNKLISTLNRMASAINALSSKLSVLEARIERLEQSQTGTETASTVSPEGLAHTAQPARETQGTPAQPELEKELSKKLDEINEKIKDMVS